MIKQLTSLECAAILQNNYIGHLGYICGNSPYVVPITYFFDKEKHCILSYSGIGFKIAAMRKKTNISLQVGNIQTIQNWRSVLVHGKFEALSGSTAEQELHKFTEGVQETILHNGSKKPKFIQDFSSRLQSETPHIVYRIRIADIQGRYRTAHFS